MSSVRSHTCGASCVVTLRAPRVGHVDSGAAPAYDDLPGLASLIWTAAHGRVLTRICRPSFPWAPADEIVERMVRLHQPVGLTNFTGAIAIQMGVRALIVQNSVGRLEVRPDNYGAAKHEHAFEHVDIDRLGGESAEAPHTGHVPCLTDPMHNMRLDESIEVG